MKIARLRLPEGVFYASLREDGYHLILGDIFADWGELSEPYDGEYTLLPPVSPSKVVCLGANYRKHAEELSLDVLPEPTIFLKPASSVIASDIPANDFATDRAIRSSRQRSPARLPAPSARSRAMVASTDEAESPSMSCGTASTLRVSRPNRSRRKPIASIVGSAATRRAKSCGGSCTVSGMRRACDAPDALSRSKAIRSRAA